MNLILRSDPTHRKLKNIRIVLAMLNSTNERWYLWFSCKLWSCCRNIVASLCQNCRCDGKVRFCYPSMVYAWDSLKFLCSFFSVEKYMSNYNVKTHNFASGLQNLHFACTFVAVEFFVWDSTLYCKHKPCVFPSWFHCKEII